MKQITILYEDVDVLVIDKPAGISVHGDGRNTDETVSDWALGKYPEMKDVGEPGFVSAGATIARPGVVHRLDRDTSGVLILAKNQKSHAFLKKQFQDRKTEKVYRAFTYGIPKDPVGLINAPIGKSRSDFRMRSVSQALGTLRDAVTEYAVLESFRVSEALSYDVSYLEAYPKTGRTHQIRVHLKSIHCPVLCDTLYAGKRNCLPELGRLGLHALSLSIQLPGGEVKIFSAPLPTDFESALARLRSLC